MSGDSGKFADKIGGYAAPGGQVSIGTQIIQGENKLRPTKYIPYPPTSNFLGREDELELLQVDLQRGDYVALAGMGGVGKTALAAQYARKYEEEYGGIVWLNAGEANLAGEVIRFFSEQLGLEIPPEKQQLTLKEQVAWCWGQYPHTKLPVLLICDDVTELGSLGEAIPNHGRFRVLITTRQNHLDPNSLQEIVVEFLPPPEAFKLLQKLLGNQEQRVTQEPEAATAILKLLGHLPLGIVLVGGYLVKDPELSLEEMVARLQEEKLATESLQTREILKANQLGVQAAFNLTWSRLTPHTQQLGKFLSLFSPQSIAWLVVVYAALEGEGELGWGEKELNEGRKELYQRNLLQRVKGARGYYQLHSLVRWFLQSQLKESGDMRAVLGRAFASALVAKARKMPQSATSHHIELFQDINPHVEELGRSLIKEVREKEREEINNPASLLEEEIPWVFVGVARFYEGKGLYQLAEAWREQCLQICQILFPGDHPKVAGSLNNLALLYESQGRYEEAEPLFLHALEMTKRLFQGDHPQVATSLNNLAGIYESQGRYQEAEPLFLHALAMTKRLFQGDHPYVALSLNNLAEIYNSQGRYEEAEPLFLDALEMRKRLFQGDHPDVALSLNNLAGIYKSQGRYEEAEPFYVDALEMRKRLFQGDHPDVALSLNNLATIYKSQGRYQEAKPLYVDALNMFQRVLGANHPNTVVVRNNLISLQNKLAALRLFRSWFNKIVRIILLPCIFCGHLSREFLTSSRVGKKHHNNT